MHLKNLPFRLESSLVRAWYRTTGQRPANTPFVSGDSFRSIADHVCEAGKRMDPAQVRNGDVVFVEAWRLASFQKVILPQLRVPFVLITHNGDLNIDESFRPLAEDERIMRWFAQNALFRHPRVCAIPIGLENRFHHYNGVRRDYLRLARRKSAKVPRILYGFTIGTNEKERRPAFEALRSSPVADALDRTNSREYRSILERHAFVASPPGNGVDCHRTWEALYLGVIPVVKQSAFYDGFPGLPVLPVRDWSEIAGWDTSFLSRVYDELAPRIETTAYLRFDYWADRVRRAGGKA